MKIRREWGMPSADTFTCPPIRSFVDFYLRQSKISVDPFARNFTRCTYTNDLNSNTKAQYNMDALDFLKMIRDKGIKPDLVVFDPPYSVTQLKECYENIGVEFTQKHAQRLGYEAELALVHDIVKLRGVVLSFGWSSTTMGKERGYAIEEILMVSHGRRQHDTICMAERRTSQQIPLFPTNQPGQADGRSIAPERLINQ